MTCNTFFGADGTAVTLDPMAVRNSLAERISAANEKFHGGGSDHLARLEGAIRNGGTA